MVRVKVLALHTAPTFEKNYSKIYDMTDTHNPSNFFMSHSHEANDTNFLYTSRDEPFGSTHQIL